MRAESILLEETRNDRYTRAESMKAEGERIIGYLCCYTPREMITAAGFVPFRIMGDPSESPTKADLYADQVLCPYARSCYDLAMKGDYDFIDGLIFPCPCDNLLNIQQIWTYSLNPRFLFSLNVPIAYDASSSMFFKQELSHMRKSLEELGDVEISDEALNEAVRLHNANRRLIKDLYYLRKEDPSLLKTSEVMQVIRNVSTRPVKESNELLADLVSGLKNQATTGNKTKGSASPRLIIIGNGLDNAELIGLIEDYGANVVIDDICYGTRFFWKEVEETNDPLESMTKHYLAEIKCSHTYLGSPDNTRSENLEACFGHIGRLAKEFKADCAMIYVIKYCDSLEWEVPDIKDYLQDIGLPVLVIEHDYSTASLAPLKTRVQAFFEMLE